MLTNKQLIPTIIILLHLKLLIHVMISNLSQNKIDKLLECVQHTSGVLLELPQTDIRLLLLIKVSKTDSELNY